MPVSYTHLPIVESVRRTAPDRSVQQQAPHQRAEPRQASPEQVDQVIASALPLTGVIPVSYTHLDVYKRQAHCRWRCAQ